MEAGFVVARVSSVTGAFEPNWDCPQKSVSDGRTAHLAVSDTRRLIFFGAALSAAQDYCGLENELADEITDVVDLMNMAFRSMVAVRPDSSKEDFALFVLSLLSDGAEPGTRHTLRLGALRYIEEHRSKLAPDIAELDTVSPTGTDVAEEKGRDGVLVTQEPVPPRGEMPSKQARGKPLDQILSEEKPARASAAGAACEAPNVEVELRSIRARRAKAIRLLRSRTRMRKASLVMMLVLVCMLAYVVTDIGLADTF